MGAEFQDPLAILRGKGIATLLNENLIKILLWVLIIYIALWMLRNFLRGMLWLVQTLLEIVSKTLGFFPSRHKKKDPLQSKDWLTRAQAKQEIRFQNACPPPLLPKEQPQKKRWRPFQKKGIGQTWYTTGWTYNEETKLWEPPDYIK